MTEYLYNIVVDNGLVQVADFQSIASADVLAALGFTPAEPVAAVAHQWINSITTGGVPQLSQPAFSDISGTIAGGQVPTLNQSTSGQAGTVATIAGLVVQGANITITGTGTLGSPLSIAASGGGGSGANPTGSVGLAVVDGSAATFLRSDGAPALNVGIAPTWTAPHVFSAGISNAGIPAVATISHVTVASGVATITTSAGHGLLQGQWAAVAAATNTSVNGFFELASVPTSTTFTFAVSASNANGTDTGSVGLVVFTIVNSSGVAALVLSPNGTSFRLGIKDSGGSNTIYYLAINSGPFFSAVNASTGANLQIYAPTIAFDNGNGGAGENISHGSGIDLVVSLGGTQAYDFGPYGFGFGSANDTTIGRLAAKVLGVGDGAGGLGWFQNSAGIARNTADVSLATTSQTGITDLTLNVIAGRKYIIRFRFKANNTTAASGLSVNFNGGTATWTYAEYSLQQIAGSPVTLGTTIAASFATALTATAMGSTSDAVFEVTASAVCNAGGTLIPTYANQNGTGTLTIRQGASLLAEDSSN